MISAAVLAAAIAAPASRNLDAFAAALQQAPGIEATLRVQQIGGAPAVYTIALAKPNLARIETPTRLSIADGETVTIFMKDKGKYIKKPQTEAVLSSLFDNMALTTFIGFFDKGALKGLSLIHI